MTGLGDLRTPAPSRVISEAYGISPDGYFIVGGARNDDGEDEPFIWDSLSGMRGLGTGLPDQLHAAADISADGSIIVGPPEGFTATAFIWDQVHGIRKLHEFLTNELGLKLTGWTLHSAAAISDDGRKIVGSGTNPKGQAEAWLAVIGEGSATPTATPTPGADCRCEVKNIFPGGTVANLSLGGKPTLAKTLGAEFAAVDNQGSNSCPDENPGTLTAEADVNFNVVDESGNVLLDRTETVTCINGVDNPEKFVVVFDAASCGPGGSNVGVFDIFTTVTGEAGTMNRTQRIRCRD